MNAMVLRTYAFILPLIVLTVHSRIHGTDNPVETSAVNVSQPTGLKMEAYFELVQTEEGPPITELSLEDVLTPPPLELPIEAVPFEPSNQTKPVPENRPILTHREEVIEEAPLVFYEPRLMTPLDQVGNAETPLLDKIVMVDSQVCGDECGGSYPNRYRPSRWQMCQVCHCDFMCQVFRDCCPSVLLKHNITYDNSPNLMECIANRAVVYDPKNLNYDDFQAMVIRCPNPATSHYSAEDRTQCEQPDLQNREQSMPVSSPATGLTYRNIFCAKCNGDDRILDQWSASVVCAKSAGPLISSTHTKEDLFLKLTDQKSVNSTTCELQYSTPSPTGLNPTKTRDGTYNRLCNEINTPLISTCNATGESRYSDPDIESACAMYESIFDGKYRNIFCYLCNQELPYSLQYLYHIVHFGYPANSARVSFAALLDFSGQDTWAGQRDELYGDRCNATQVFDANKCECQELQCSEGKYLDFNGTCHSLMKTDMLGYRACHRLDLRSDTPISEDSLRRFMRETPHNLFYDVREHTCQVLEYCPNGLSASLSLESFITKYGTLDYLEDVINTTLGAYFSMVNYVWPSGLTYKISTMFPCSAEYKRIGQCSSNTSYFIDSISVMGPIMHGTRTDIYYINYTQTSGCAFISLKANIVAEDGYEKLVFEPTGEEISPDQATLLKSSIVDSGDVNVCLSEYKRLSKTSSCQNDFDTWTISGLVSIISTSVSLLCLALTFATYSFITPLRSGGGKNIMVLTALLFAAQALYEFGIEQYENRHFCQAVGLGVHYFWLAAVFSMNACTVERFLKLCYPLKTRSFFLSERRPFMLATTYSILCPAILVGINATVNIVSRGNSGYGSPSLCYINSRTSRIAAFAVPMGVVVLSNVILMGITVWVLKRRSGNSGGESDQSLPPNKLQATKSSKMGLLGCVRLSVVTGITWLLVFLYEAVPSEALSYVITALVGLQGLIFFLSMVVNKRVVSMLEKYIKSSTLRHSSSSGSNSSKNNPHRKYKTKETVTDKLSDSTVNTVSK